MPYKNREDSVAQKRRYAQSEVGKAAAEQAKINKRIQRWQRPTKQERLASIETSAMQNVWYG
jgi:hypothetical protein